MGIFILAFTLLHFLGMVESVAQRFRLILELDGVHMTGAFDTHSGIYNDIRCARRCIKNGCLTFIYHVGERKCYLYDSPLTRSTTGISFPGNSLAYMVNFDVLTPGVQLYHYISTRNEAWIVTLTTAGVAPSLTWQQSKDTCAQMGGGLLPVHDTGMSDIFNDLDTAYPGTLLSTDREHYWVGLNKTGGVWQHVDGTTASGLNWHSTQPSGTGLVSDPDVCGDLWKKLSMGHTTFKLADNSCSKLFRYVCSFQFNQ